MSILISSFKSKCSILSEQPKHLDLSRELILLGGTQTGPHFGLTMSPDETADYVRWFDHPSSLHIISIASCFTLKQGGEQQLQS